MAANSISFDIDEKTQTEAMAILNKSGLSITDFLRMSLSRLTLEKHLPKDMSAVPNTQAEKQKSLADYKAFGMWADRDDMKDPAEWLKIER